MSYNINDLFVARNSRSASYQIEQSLRVNRDDSANMSRTFNDGGSSHTQWTFSFWTKRHLKSGTSDEIVFYTNKGSGYSRLDFGSGGGRGVSLLQYNGSSWDYKLFTDEYLRDPSAWYHIVWVYDSPNATSTDRLRIYINGTRAVPADVQYPSQNFASEIGKDVLHYLFRGNNYGTSYYNGYAAETYFIDNQALTADDFGKLDNNGVWRPIEYTGTYGGNSFYQKYESSGIGDDSSGEGNNWTTFSGFTTSGTGTDVMSDTPTNNHCTWNPLAGTNGSFSEGNLTGSMPGARCGTLGVSSGKWYWECKYNAGNSFAVAQGAIVVSSGDPTNTFGNGVVWYSGVSDGRYGSDYGTYVMGSFSNYGGTWWTGTNTFGMALDLDSAQNTMTFYRNGTSYGAVNIPSGHTWAPAYASGSGAATGSFTLYIDENTWTYTAPTGFSALNTSNLPAPDIADASDYFNTLLYTGDSINNRTITGVGFQPDFVWVKNRSDTDGWPHLFTDAVRGGGPSLQSNNTSVELAANPSGYVSAFASDGFVVTIGDTRFANTNGSGQTYVSWNWLAGGSGSSNTAGSITSTVSANPTAGFSIVTYTGTGSAATVGHGLGVPPAFMMIKCRNKTFGWTIYHQSLGNTRHLEFTDSTGFTGDAWNSTNPTSSVFSIGTDAGSNNSSSPPNNYVAYCFAEIEGYSKFGSYTGNGSTDGPFIYCGFRPAWVMIKETSNARDWQIQDTARTPYNWTCNALFPNLSSAENTSEAQSTYGRDYLSNGFKIRASHSTHNTSGSTYIFVAFAENPFGGDGVSPATAR